MKWPFFYCISHILVNVFQGCLAKLEVSNSRVTPRLFCMSTDIPGNLWIPALQNGPHPVLRGCSASFLKMQNLIPSPLPNISWIWIIKLTRFLGSNTQERLSIPIHLFQSWECLDSNPPSWPHGKWLDLKNTWYANLGKREACSQSSLPNRGSMPLVCS